MALPLPTPAATRIVCNLNSPYFGVSQPGFALYLLDVHDNCAAKIETSRSDKVYGWGSWLPDGSGFVYLEGDRDLTTMNVCVWDLAKQTTTRCLLEDVNNYMQAIWSPGNTNYMAYRRWDRVHDREFLTVTSVDSSAKQYETDLTQAGNGVEERFLAWHPDGKHMLIVVNNGHEQIATILDVESLSRIILAQFNGGKEYIAKGLWINDGQDVVLSTIDPELCCTGERRPEAKNLYRVHNDGDGFKSLVKDVNIATFLVDHDQRRLLLDTYSNGNDPSPAYWLDLNSGKLTRVFSDEVEGRSPQLLGLTPDDRYIVLSDGQYQTWLFDTRTEQLTQSSLEIYDTIEWRP